MNMDAALSTLDTRLIQLPFARERTEETIQSKRCDKIERQIKALKRLSGEEGGFGIFGFSGFDSCLDRVFRFWA